MYINGYLDTLLTEKVDLLVRQEQVVYAWRHFYRKQVFTFSDTLKTCNFCGIISMYLLWCHMLN